VVRYFMTEIQRLEGGGVKMVWLNRKHLYSLQSIYHNSGVEYNSKEHIGTVLFYQKQHPTAGI
jgi:hypothetical protein